MNAIGSAQVFYPIINYLSSSPEFVDLVSNEWTSSTSKDDLTNAKAGRSVARKTTFDGK